jgi:hypothetical protein
MSKIDIWTIFGVADDLGGLSEEFQVTIAS